MPDPSIYEALQFLNTCTKAEAAQIYGQMGIPILPLREGRKEPLEGFMWKSHATTDPDAIRRMWEQYPDANIGGVMGEVSGLICSDLDCKNGENGWASYQDLAPGEVHGPIAQTPSGGYHVLHQYVPGLYNFTKKGRYGGIDMRTNDSGYIVLAPSVLVEDPKWIAGRYQWVQGGRPNGMAGPLEQAYQAWSVERKKRNVDMPTPTPLEDLKPLQDTFLRQHHIGFLERGEMAEQYEGDRSRALFGALQALYRQGFSDEQVLGYLENSYALEVAQDHRNSRGDPLEWLWQHNCLKVDRESIAPPQVSVGEAFGHLTLNGVTVSQDCGQDIIPAETIEKRVTRMAQDVAPGDYKQAEQIYGLAYSESPSLASYVAGLMPFNKMDLERVRKTRTQKEKSQYKTERIHANLLEVPANGDFSSCKQIMGHFIYVADENSWYNRHTGISLGPDSMNNHYRHLTHSMSNEEHVRMTDVLTTAPNALKVDTRTYWPGIESEIITADNLIMLNSWQPSRLQKDIESWGEVVVTDEKIRSWLEHLNYLIDDPDVRNHILDFMAFTMQFPEIKINHALLIGGNERIGKDSLFMPMSAYIGETNTKEIDAKRLDENFRDYLIAKKLIIIQEIYKSLYKDALATENQLKNLLAAPPLNLSIPRKGKVDMIQPNLLGFVIFTNYRSAIHLSSEGDRYFCAWSNAVKREKVYYKALHDWFQAGGLGWVAKWLLQRDVSGFDPKAPAPVTEWRYELQEGGKTDCMVEMCEVIEQWHQEGKAFFTAAQLQAEMERDPEAKRRSKNAITRALNEMHVGRVSTSDKNRLNIPKVFDARSTYPAEGEAFRIRTKAAVYLTDLSLKGLQNVDHEEVKMGLCPLHLLGNYEKFRNVSSK